MQMKPSLPAFTCIEGHISFWFDANLQEMQTSWMELIASENFSEWIAWSPGENTWKRMDMVCWCLLCKGPFQTGYVAMHTRITRIPNKLNKVVLPGVPLTGGGVAVDKTSIRTELSLRWRLEAWCVEFSIQTSQEHITQSLLTMTVGRSSPFHWDLQTM